MQVIFEDEDERGDSRGISSMDSLICTGRVSRCVEGEYTGRFGGRKGRMQISWEIFGGIKENLEEEMKR